jgi:hypothetical protein
MHHRREAVLLGQPPRALDQGDGFPHAPSELGHRAHHHEHARGRLRIAHALRHAERAIRHRRGEVVLARQGGGVGEVGQQPQVRRMIAEVTRTSAAPRSGAALPARGWRDSEQRLALEAEGHRQPGLVAGRLAQRLEPADKLESFVIGGAEVCRLDRSLEDGSFLRAGPS